MSCQYKHRQPSKEPSKDQTSIELVVKLMTRRRGRVHINAVLWGVKGNRGASFTPVGNQVFWIDLQGVYNHKFPRPRQKVAVLRWASLYHE